MAEPSSPQAAPHEPAYSLSATVRELPPLVIEDTPHELSADCWCGPRVDAYGSAPHEPPLQGEG